MKRLNTVFIGSDLKHYLKEKIQNGENGSFKNVLEWMREYNIAIEKVHKEIIDKISVLFPTAIIRLQCSYDEETTYLVRIYGIEDNKDEVYKLCNDLAENELNSDYLLIPSIINKVATIKYYPDIYEEYMEKNNL